MLVHAPDRRGALEALGHVQERELHDPLEDLAGAAAPPRQASEPNSTSTGVGVFTSVLNFSLPFDG